MERRRLEDDREAIIWPLGLHTAEVTLVGVTDDGVKCRITGQLKFANKDDTSLVVVSDKLVLDSLLPSRLSDHYLRLRGELVPRANGDVYTIEILDES